MAGISSKAALSSLSAYKYNAGSELEDEGDLNYYNTFYRKYDAQIGRFTGVDVMAESFAGLTPFQYGNNNPVFYNDPLGDKFDNPGRSVKGPDGNYHQAWVTEMMGGNPNFFVWDESDGGSGGGGGSRMSINGVFSWGGQAQALFAALKNAYNNLSSNGQWSFTAGYSNDGNFGYWQPFKINGGNEAGNGLLAEVMVGTRWVPLGTVDNKSFIAIMNDPKAVYGMGHSALLVGSDQDGIGWSVISKVGRKDGFTLNNNPVSGGPAKPRREVHFNTLKDFLNAKEFSSYTRVAFYSIQGSNISTSINEMRNQADSYYSVFYNNCGHAISNTFEMIGLTGVNIHANNSYGYSTPNYMYSYMMTHNPNSFSHQIVR